MVADTRIAEAMVEVVGVATEVVVAAAVSCFRSDSDLDAGWRHVQDGANRCVVWSFYAFRDSLPHLLLENSARFLDDTLSSLGRSITFRRCFD